MTFRYAIKWAYIEFVVALVMTLVVYAGLRPEWWGWLLYLPLFLYLVFEGVRKTSYSLTVDGDRITVGSLKSAQYSVSRITAVNVWDAKGGRVAVVDFVDGSRFNFPSRLERFDDLVGLLRTKANLPEPGRE
jgi:hypothetical protein